MSDIVSKIFSSLLGIVSDPKRAIIIILIILFFPLNLLDYLIWIIISFCIIILNTVLWILILVVNTLIAIINMLVSLIISAINTIPDMVIGSPGTLAKFEYFKQDWVEVNIFGTTTCLFTIMLGMFGISFPIW